MQVSHEARSSVWLVVVAPVSLPIIMLHLTKHPFRILKINKDGLYSYYQNGTYMKRKPHPENANYQVRNILHI